MRKYYFAFDKNLKKMTNLRKNGNFTFVFFPTNFFYFLVIEPSFFHQFPVFFSLFFCADFSQNYFFHMYFFRIFLFFLIFFPKFFSKFLIFLRWKNGGKMVGESESNSTKDCSFIAVVLLFFTVNTFYIN